MRKSIEPRSTGLKKDCEENLEPRSTGLKKKDYEETHDPFLLEPRFLGLKKKDYEEIHRTTIYRIEEVL